MKSKLLANITPGEILEEDFLTLMGLSQYRPASVDVARVSLGLAFDLQKPQHRVAVLRFEGLLFAGARVPQGVVLPATIQGEPLFHSSYHANRAE